MPDENGISRCRSCNAAIIWCTTENGKSMPIDLEPGGLGPKGEPARMRKERLEGDKKIVHFVKDSELEDNTRHLYHSHFVTCPQGKEWSKR